MYSLQSLLYKLNRGSIENSAILEKINKDSPLSLSIESNNFLFGDNKYVDMIDWKKGISKDIVTDDGSYVIINVNEVLPAGNMTLNAVKGKVISDYQKFLDDQWILYLRDKYKYSVNKDLLYTLIK